jgi:toxin ParE1/3/4
VPHQITQQALSDLEDIWCYVATEASPHAADALIDSITQRFLLLAEHPRAGRPREDLRADLRSFAVASHVILYRIQDEQAIILRIMHGSRDLTAL